MHGDDDQPIIEAAPRRSLLAVLAELSPLDEEFAEIDDPVPRPIDL